MPETTVNNPTTAAFAELLTRFAGAVADKFSSSVDLSPEEQLKAPVGELLKSLGELLNLDVDHRRADHLRMCRSLTVKFDTHDRQGNKSSRSRCTRSLPRLISDFKGDRNQSYLNIEPSSRATMLAVPIFRRSLIPASAYFRDCSRLRI